MPPTPKLTVAITARHTRSLNLFMSASLNPSNPSLAPFPLAPALTHSHPMCLHLIRHRLMCHHLMCHHLIHLPLYHLHHCLSPLRTLFPPVVPIILPVSLPSLSTILMMLILQRLTLSPLLPLIVVPTGVSGL